MKIQHRTFIYILLSVLFIVVTNVGYVHLASRSTDEYHYTGANQYTAADKLVYMSLIQQGREGKIFMRNLHTIEPQQGLLFSPHWYLIGQTGKLFNISNNASYQLYRLVFTILFLILLYKLLNHLFSKTSDIIGSALFVLFSGGFGWFALLTNQLIFETANTTRSFFITPIDLYVTEGNTLLNFAQSPLFSLSQLLLLLVFYLFVKQYKNSLVADTVIFLSITILGIIHPYEIPLFLTILGTWMIWDLRKHHSWKVVRRFMFIIAGTLVAAGYNFWIITVEPILAEWLKQNLVFSPPLPMYLLGYGLLLPLGIIGVIYSMLHLFSARPFSKKIFERIDTLFHEDIIKNTRWWVLILIWSTFTWLLLYLPTTINRRFINGYHIPLAIVAFIGARLLWSAIDKKWLRGAFGSFIALGLIGNCIFFIVLSFTFDPSLYTNSYHFTSTEQNEVFAYIESTTNPDDHILTSYNKDAYLLAGMINRLVYRGHNHQTPHSNLIKQKEEWFFTEPTTETTLVNKEQFLADEQIEVILVNRSTLEFESDWIDSLPNVEREMTTKNYTLYRIISDTETSTSS